ncbi:MAG TPA: AIR synthase-related protein [Anaerolineae bacterium]|nr:AIR synthase-related protein [Anaerolineae bacterium]
MLVGAQIGADAAVLDFCENLLIIATDLITFATKQIGWFAVQINANDVAVRGARPRWFLAVVLLPEDKTDHTLASNIFDQIRDSCAALGCTLIGGHIELTQGLERPIVVGQMLGEVSREKLVTTAGAQVGDVLLLTKGLAIEGTALLARERTTQLRAGGMADDLITRVPNYLYQPGWSIVRDALTANAVSHLHAMHDPTEGGLATALFERADAAQVGIVVERAGIPILPESERLCAILGLDPPGLLASGALLLAVAPNEAGAVIQALTKEEIGCTPIGHIVPREEGLQLSRRVREQQDMTHPEFKE